MLNALLLFTGLGLGVQSTGVDPVGQEAGAEPVAQMITAEYPISSLGWVLGEISKESGLRIRPGGEAEKHYLAIKVEDVEVTDLLEQIAYVTESRWEMEDDIWLLRPDEAVRAESRARAVAARKEVLEKLLSGTGRYDGRRTPVFSQSLDIDEEDFNRAMMHLDLDRIAAMSPDEVIYFSDRPNARQEAMPEAVVAQLTGAVQTHNNAASHLDRAPIAARGSLLRDESLDTAMALLKDFAPRPVDLDKDKLVITIQRFEGNFRALEDCVYSCHIGFYDESGELLFGGNSYLQSDLTLIQDYVDQRLQAEPFLRLSRRYYADPRQYVNEFVPSSEETEILEQRARPAIEAIQIVSGKNLVANISDSAYNLNSPMRSIGYVMIEFPQAYSEIIAHHSIEEVGSFLRIKPLDAHSARENRFDRGIIARLSALECYSSIEALDVMSQIALENTFLPVYFLYAAVQPNELARQLLHNRFWLAFYGSLNQVQRERLFSSASLSVGSLSPQSKELLLRIVDNSGYYQARMELSRLQLNELTEAFIIENATIARKLSNWNPSEKLPNGVSDSSVIYLNPVRRPAAFLKEPHPRGTGFLYSSFDLPEIADQIHRLDRQAAGHSFVGTDRSESSFVGGQILALNLIFEVAPNCVVFGRLHVGEPDSNQTTFRWSEFPPHLIGQARNFMETRNRFSRYYVVPPRRVTDDSQADLSTREVR